MVLTIKDMELLKLICWCKNIPSPAEINYELPYNLKDLSNLENMGLLSKSIDGRNIRPRLAAYRLLEDAGFNFKSEKKPQTGERILRRRNIAAQILFTFHTAGISVFNDEIDETIIEPLYISSFAARARDYFNPFGSTKYHGIFYTPQEAFLVFYADNAGVYYTKELTLFHKLTEKTGITKNSIVFMGNSTARIGEIVIDGQKENQKGKYNTNSFAEIQEISPVPIHFIPLGDAGAQVLRFMLIPNYKEEVAKAALKDSYRKPYDGLTDTDTIHNKKPYYPAVVAVDMDVNRIDRAIVSAQENGFEKIVIYALKEQTAFLKSRYSMTGKADVIQIQIMNNRLVANCDISLYKPPAQQYVTKEGRCFDASDFSIYRKVGKSARQEDRPVSEP